MFGDLFFGLLRDLAFFLIMSLMSGAYVIFCTESSFDRAVTGSFKFDLDLDF